jgi:ribosomal protein L11 methyltransferase
VDWVEVIVPATAASVDEVAAMLVDEVPAAAAGVEIRGAEAVFWAPLADRESALAATRAAVAGWRESGFDVDPDRVTAAPAVPEAEWRDAWKRYFHTTRLTRRLVVVPSWESHAPAPDDLVITLDPGLAFGTGTHASTRLVLEELQALADAGADVARVLDVGAGSGILAIAACKLWPRATAVATDIDPLAVAACAENAAANAVGDRIASRSSADAPLPALDRFPLVLANIQAHVLRELRAELVARCAPGATLVLSGLLTPQAQAVADEFAAAGLAIARVRPGATADDAQWSVVVLIAPAAP